MKTFGIEIGGQRWNGAWEVDGRDLLVQSAYGSDRKPLGRRKPESVAADVMREIVEAWRARSRA